MSKRGENIHKRKDGRWEGRYRKGRDDVGKILYGYVYGRSYREAKEKLWNAQKNTNTQVKIPANEMTLSQVVEQFLDVNRMNQKESTRKRYWDLYHTHIEPSIGSTKLSQINALKIDEFLAQKLISGRIDKQGGLSAAYVRGIAQLILASMDYAAREGFCLPLKSEIHRPVVPKRKCQILDPYFRCQLEKNILQNPTPTKIGILISLRMGLRLGEICALRWCDIDLENRILHVRHTVARIQNTDNMPITVSCLILDTPKTASSIRDIPISDCLTEFLKREKKNALSDFVISENDHFVSPRTFDYRFHRVLKECNITPINFHILRHTFATNCVEAGVDLKSLSEILGHSNVSITLNTYVHSSMEMKRSQLEKLNSSFGKIL